MVTTSAPKSSRHVVVLDDDTEMLRGVERMLARAGFRVTATPSAKEAMEAVVCSGADAIVSDLHLPDMGGHIVLSMLSHAAPRTARLLLTSETDFEKVAAMTPPYAIHALVAKRDAAERLVPTLDELCAGRPEENDTAMSEHARGLARSVVRALAMRNYETVEHCERVAAWSRRLASAMNLSPSRILDVELGALLHDVGQIGVPDAILLKPGALDAAEWAELKRHPELGVALLKEIPALRRAIPIVQSHHERRDGKGYPRGLTGNAIPLDVRIFQVVDTYDALTSDRPYRKRCSDEEARAEIASNVGPQFDPEVHDAFCAIDPEEWRAVIAKVGQ